MSGPGLVRWAAAAAGRGRDRARGWATDLARALAAHPARLVWTLLVTLAYAAAAQPLWAYGHALWQHFSTGWFLINQQFDYGEGPMFNQEVLLFHGKDIYTLANTPPFTVGNYPPVFPLVASLLMRVHGIGLTFMAGRLTSSLSVMASAAVAGLIVLQATRQLVAACIGGGLLLTFSEIYGWGPYNRVDSLAMLLSLCTVLIALRYAGTRKAWWVLPLAVLTLYTRQSNVDGILAAFVYMFWRNWRQCLVIGAASVAVVLALFVGLQAWSHGAFYLDTVVFNENAWNWGTVTANWSRWMRGEGGLFVFRLALAGAAAGILGRGGVLWPVWLAASALVFATIGKVGSSINYFFPIQAATSVCVGVFIGRFRAFFRRAPFPLWPVELLLPAMLFVYVHGSAPTWAAHVPLLRRAEAAAGGWTLARAQVAADARREAPQWARDRQLRAQGLPVPAPRLQTPAGTAQQARYFASIPGPVLGLDFPYAEVVQGGHEMQWQPFELGVAYADGHWDPTPLVQAIQQHYYSVIFFKSFNQFMGYDGGFGSRVIAAIEQSYHQSGTQFGWQIWQPDAPAAGPPPVGPVAVPHPLRGLPRALWKALRGLPARLRSAGGRPATLSGGPRTLGAFTEVSLSRLFDLQVAAQPGSPPGLGYAGFDGTFALPVFPEPGTLLVRAAGQRVPVYVPPAGPGQLSAVLLLGAADVALPAQRDGAVWLLESGVSGAQSVPIVLDYARGAAGALTARFSDWCAPATPPEYRAFTTPYRLGADGSEVAGSCGMFVLRIAADPSRVLAAVQVGPNINARLMAVTVQKA